MARIPQFGSSQPVSTADFQDRLKRIFEGKPDLTQPPARPAPKPNRKSLPFKS